MFFWLAVLGGLAFALWAAFRLGLYEMIALFVNLVVAVYLALFATPTLIALIPAAADIPYGALVSAAVVAGLTFGVLHALCFAILTGQFKVSFPRVLDGVLAGALGFFAGFLIVAFLTSLLALAPGPAGRSPVTENDRRVHASYVCWWCDRVDTLVGSAASAHPTQDSLDQLGRLSIREPVPASVEPNTPSGGIAPRALN
jgi:hypothetical protein